MKFPVVIVHAQSMLLKKSLIDFYKDQIKAGFSHDEALALIEGSSLSFPNLVPIIKVWLREWANGVNTQ